MIGSIIPWGLMLCAAGSEPEPILSDPAYRELGKLVGGEWTGTAGDAIVHNRFTFAVDGKMIKGSGYVEAKGKTILVTQPNLGWDPEARRVSYVDFHNHDTVYLGHVSMDKEGWLVYDFTEFANPKKHYTGKSKFLDRNHYEFQVGREVIKMTRSYENR